MSKRVLDINDLNVGFSSYGETTKIVTDVSFHIDEGETVGIVGESGCGKSMTALSVMRLIKCPPGYIKGEIRLNGKNLLELSERQMCDVRGKDVSMIFQEPMTSLNPVITIGKQLMEVFRSHEKMTREEAWKKSVEALELVKIASPEQRMKEYPHQLSGGMRQRVMIAMALSCRPRLLIADEPTTALDVTIQAQILKLMRNLKETLDTSVMLITHDLGVVPGGLFQSDYILLRAGHRGGAGGGAVREPLPSLHPGTFEVAARDGEPGPALRDTGHRAQSGESAGGLRVQSQMRPCHREMQKLQAADDRYFRRTLRPLLALRQGGMRNAG